MYFEFALLSKLQKLVHLLLVLVLSFVAVNVYNAFSEVLHLIFSDLISYFFNGAYNIISGLMAFFFLLLSMALFLPFLAGCIAFPLLHQMAELPPSFEPEEDQPEGPINYNNSPYPSHYDDAPESTQEN